MYFGDARTLVTVASWGVCVGSTEANAQLGPWCRIAKGILASLVALSAVQTDFARTPSVLGVLAKNLATWLLIHRGWTVVHTVGWNAFMSRRLSPNKSQLRNMSNSSTPLISSREKLSKRCRISPKGPEFLMSIHLTIDRDPTSNIESNWKVMTDEGRKSFTQSIGLFCSAVATTKWESFSRNPVITGTVATSRRGTSATRRGFSQ